MPRVQGGRSGAPRATRPGFARRVCAGRVRRAGRIRLVIRAAILALLAVALAACGRPDSGFVEYRLFAMATWIDLTLPADATREHPGLIADIEAELADFGRDYYAWADGELARLNAALSAHQSFEASPALVAMLLRAQEVARASDGAFDPGVGALVELYGFHDATAEPPAPPTDEAIAAERAAAGSVLDLAFAGNRITGRDRRYLLDLGAIAKGSAVDGIVLRLEALGIGPALVNAGGNLRAVGPRPEQPWRIGIQAPRIDGVLGSVELLRGEAASTSGDYERFRDREGLRLHHILDPRTGRPAAHTEAVTVLAADAELADAASTALFVAGPDHGLAVADRLSVQAALRVDADGRIEMTREMRDRFQAGAAGASAIIAVVD